MIPTAEEFLEKKGLLWRDDGVIMADYVSPNDLIEFAKMHVEAALKEASDKAIYTGYNLASIEIDKDSILKAYPLTNIK